MQMPSVIKRKSQKKLRWGEIFRSSRPAVGPNQPPVQWVLGFSQGKLQPGRAADPSPPSSAAVMEHYSYTSIHPLGHTIAYNRDTLPYRVFHCADNGVKDQTANRRNFWGATGLPSFKKTHLLQPGDVPDQFNPVDMMRNKTCKCHHQH